MSQLIIEDVRKSYGLVDVLKGVSIDIESGEFCVFVGPSGCGKSTLLRMIAGLETITSGEIRLEGRLINNVDPAKRSVAMVFQNYALYPHMTIAENMAFSLRLSRAPKAERDEKVRKAARILRLEQLLDRRPSQLSGGQKQRVAIGRAIVRQPKVFLFDEPLSNLDAELRVQMRAELAELHQRLGTTMIYVTHDQVEAMTLADKMVVMNGGVVQQQGRPLDLYDDPANTFVGGFVGTPRMNFLRGRVVQSGNAGLKLSVLDGTAGELVVPSTTDLPIGTEIQVGIRPEHLHPTPPGASVALPVRVGLVEELGSMSLFHGRLPDNQQVSVQLVGTRQGSSDVIHVAPETNRICLFDAAGERVHF